MSESAIWVKVFPPVVPPPEVAFAEGSGGTESMDGTTKVCTFTADGTLTVTKAGFAEILVCGGGSNGTYGAGGTNPAGGGGGGVRFGWFKLEVGTYTITVGAGGVENTNGGDGGPSSVVGTGLDLTVGGGMTNTASNGGYGGGGGSLGRGNNGAGGGAGGEGNGTTPGAGITWHGVEYGRGNWDTALSATHPGMGGRKGANANPGYRGQVVVRFEG